MYETIKTFVDGLDEKMEGGIPKGHAVLVAGTAGSMKSTFAFSILYHNATHKKKHGVYITLEQGEDSLHQQMDAMGFRMALVKEELTFVDVSKIRGGLDDFGKTGAWLDFITEVLMEIHQFKPIDIVAFDSLGLIEVMTDMKNPRKDLFGMIRLIKKLGATALLINEMSMGSMEFGRHDEDFLVDGIVHLRQQEIHDVDHENWMRIVKMRGVKHTTSYQQVHFKDGRFSVSTIVPE
jgi:KaiC/GvpD/RAD55 family RecA-like ATPase